MTNDIGSKITVPGRIGIVDSLRGAALVAMATYHFTWDLEFFGYLDPGTSTQGFFRLYARAIASSFLFLAGFGLVLAHGRGIRWQSFGRRFAMIAAAALAISAATYWFVPDGWIFFGILHAIALGSLIGLAFLSVPAPITVLVALGAIALPQFYRSELFDPSWLAWIGLFQSPPRSNDFVPLLPWISAVLFGIAAGKLAVAREWLPSLARLPSGPRLLNFAGRHSLAFYLLHQPVLISVVYLASLIAPPAPADPVAGYISSCEASCVTQGESAPICTRFCGCTLDKLMEQGLFTPLQSGAIQPSEDARILELARECTAVSH
ncbi:DUF1624 domain-containing protein [Rhizobium sp. RU36D]|uniref:DUF1624 domain-containing protein n=1 Tax=Rhizobium sp. RU36D TaxID=1907415 RepID=UPI0009D8D642|nr:DUF1624 domain-containing protein [Rhizobium sp. RU36D]SMC82906.1 Uncharacterized membrane protein [Rhizobium sp. RU36D]